MSCKVTGVAMAVPALFKICPIFGRSSWSYYDSFALLDRQNWLGITGADPCGLADRLYGRAALCQ